MKHTIKIDKEVWSEATRTTQSTTITIELENATQIELLEAVSNARKAINQ